MAIYNGTNIVLYIPTQDVDSDSSTTTWEPAALARSSSLSITQAHPDTSNKDSSGWADSLQGQRNWSVTFDGLTDFTLTLAASRPNVRAFWTYINTRSRFKISWGQDGYHFYGDVGVADLSINSEAEQPGTQSVSLTGKGALSLTADASSDIDAAATYPHA